MRADHFHYGFRFLAGLVADDAALIERESYFGTGQDREGRHSKRCRIAGVMVLCVLTSMVADVGRAAEPVFDIDIPAMNAAEALNRLAEQTGSVMLFSYDLARAREANAVRGRYTLLEGLELLLRDTGLSGGLSDKRVVIIAANGNVPGGKGETVKKRGLLAALIAALFGSAAGESSADQTEERARQETPIEEIIVTAQKREERLLDVPQSVSVLSADTLARLGAVEFRDFANTVPGLTFATAGVGFTQISLRGVTAGFDVASTVGIYVDEVPFGSSTTFANGARATLDLGLFDIDRIEVLRGPQGTLYGASTMGGLIKYVSKSPDASHFGGLVRAGVSSTEEGDLGYNVSAVLNAPIKADKVALRASAFESRDGGYVDNLARDDEDVNRSDVYGGRLDLLLTPNDALTFRIGGYVQNIDRDGPASADYTAAGVPVDGAVEQRRLLAEPFQQQFRLLSATASYDFSDSRSLTSISSYQTADMEFGQDVSTRFVPLFALPAFGSRSYSAVLLGETADTDKFTQEVRFAAQGVRPLEWVIGGFYTRETSHRTQALLPRDPAGQPAPADLLNFASPSRYEEYAAFGDVTWYLTSRLDVTGGVRYAENRQVFTQFGSGLLITSRPPNRSSEDVFTYLANARFHFGERAVGYLRYATGYRPGGPNFVVNDPTTGLPIAPTSYEADRLKSYEAGFKAETVGQRFGFELAAYEIDWDNIQILVNRGGLSVIGNAESGALVRGAELALTTHFGRAFIATGSLTYQDASLRRANADLRAAEGERLPNVPDFVAALSADYSLPGGREWSPRVGATARYVSDRRVSYNASVAPPQYRLPSYETLDLRAGISIRSIDAQLYVRNVFDERGQLYMPTTVVNATSPRPVTILQPRTIGITVTADF